MKIKVCGMKYPENIKTIQNFEPDFMGFIFYDKSPRYVTDKTLFSSLNKKLKTVGVFVNNPINEVLEIVAECKLDFVQLHGNESVDYVKQLSAAKVKLIKAFQITEDFDWKSVSAFAPFVTYFLFDTATPNYGGSGLKFNWKQLDNYKEEVPFFLSGGITINDVQAIKELDMTLLFAIDINSKFETELFLKDAVLVNRMINKVKDEKHISRK